MNAITALVALAATLACASPACTGTLKDGAPFKLVAYDANISTSTPYAPQKFLQYFQPSSADELGLFSFSGGVAFDYGDNFTYERADKRLVTTLTNQTGTYTYKTIAPTPGDALNFTEVQPGKNGLIVETVNGPCKASPGQDYFFVDGSSDDADYYHPWMLCQVEGYTTGIKNVRYARGLKTLPEGCRKIALKPVPA